MHSYLEVLNWRNWRPAPERASILKSLLIVACLRGGQTKLPTKSTILGRVTICQNWLAESASRQMDRGSSFRTMRKLVVTKVVIFSEQGHFWREPADHF